MKWLLSSPFVAFDVETTGVDVETDRIVTAAVVTLQPKVAGQPWQVETSRWLLNPGMEIPAEATAIHGITTEHAKAGREPAEVLEKIAYALVWRLGARWPLVGFNLAFDLTLLDRELRRHQLPTLDVRLGRSVAPCVDPYVLDKQVDPYRRGGRKLADMCAHYGVTHDSAHDAGADALAAARLAYRIAQFATLAGLPGVSWACSANVRISLEPDIRTALTGLATLGKAELHQAQVGWRAGQMAALAEYFRAQGKPADDMDGQWPQRAWREPGQ